MLRRLTVVILLLTFTGLAVAQRRTGDTMCELSIRVRSTHDRNYDTPVQVELLSPQGTPVSVVFTSGAGSAEFHVASGATYRVRLSGDGIETITTPEFTILNKEQSHMETVNVKLLDRPKTMVELTPRISISRPWPTSHLLILCSARRRVTSRR